MIIAAQRFRRAFICLFSLALAGHFASAATPLRIVSAGPSITETLFALGLGDRVVGVSAYCRFPEKANHLPRVGTYLKPNIEVIARLKPDLVIMEKLPESAAGGLRNLGLHVTEVEYGGVARNLETIRVIGRAAMASDAAERLTKQIRDELEKIRSQSARMAPLSVVFIVGRMPGTLTGLAVPGGSSYLSELLAIAGGRNIFEDAHQAYFNTSLEAILRRNPDVVIDRGDMAESGDVTDQHKREVVNLWKTQRGLSAVKSNRVFAVSSDIFVVPGPRMLDAARAFQHMLHPELPTSHPDSAHDSAH